MDGSLRVKLQQLIRKKVLKFALPGNSFSDLFLGQNFTLEDFQVCFRTFSQKLK